MNGTVLTTEMLLPILYIPLLLLGLSVAYTAIVIILERNKYYDSIYYSATKIKFLKVIFDTGRCGEYRTSQHLKSIEGYKKLLLNVYLPTHDQQTTEVDIIAITQKGIIVIENKNYHGTIYGSEQDVYWTQALGGKKHKFYNPIRQNDGHVKALKLQLPGISEFAYTSLTVFNDNCTLKKIQVSDSCIVVQAKQLRQTIQEMFSKKPVIFSKQSVVFIYDSFNVFTNAEDSIKQSHIRRVNAFK